MQNIANLFRKPRFEDFIRVIIFDNSITLIHIKSKHIDKEINTTLPDKKRIFEYIRCNLSIPVEIIISSNTMSCRSVDAEDLSKKELKTLAINTLIEKKDMSNLVCYERKTFHKKGSTFICDMKLSSVGLGAIQELLNIENSITSVSSWPFWIVSSYFDFYPEEIDKFSAYTFIVENEKEWEIIIIRNKEYVCYRRGNIENFDKKTETENSIKFIVQNFNIDPNDVVICAISDKTISSFIQSSTIDMNIISNSVSFDISHEPNNLNKIAKILCSIIFFGISLNMISDIFKIRSYGEKIENAENTISLIDPNMVKEIATWENINESDCLFKPDFKSALRKKTSELGQKLQNVSMEVDDKTKEIILKTIYDEN